MAFTITHVIFFVAVGLLSLFFILPWFANEFPTARAALENIIPNLQQAEKLSSNQGFKALHVKIKSGDPVQLYEFHPTNEGDLGKMHFSAQASAYENYFFLKKFEADKCYVFATPEISSVYGESWIYRVYPGSKVLKASQSLTTDLSVENQGCDPHGKCSDMNPGEFTVCADGGPSYEFASCASSNNGVKNQVFTSSTTDNCIANEKDCPFVNGKKDCCAFAAEQSGGNHIYAPAYNLICGYEQGSSEADWYACGAPVLQNAVVGTEPNGGGTQFSCSGGSWNIKSGSGVYILYPQVKYQGTADADVTLQFTLANYEAQKQNAIITATVTNVPADSGCSVFNQRSLSKNCGTIAENGPCEYNSQDISYWHNLCWSAKTFDISLAYSGGSRNFKIACPNANIYLTDIWQTCAVTSGNGGSTGSGTGGGTGSTLCPTSIGGYTCTDPTTCSNFGGTPVSGRACTTKGEICCADRLAPPLP